MICNDKMIRVIPVGCPVIITEPKISATVYKIILWEDSANYTVVYWKDGSRYQIDVDAREIEIDNGKHFDMSKSFWSIKHREQK